MQDDFFVPVTLFPQRRGEIEALASASESFRSLCDDLAEAAAALEKWTELGTPAGQRNAQEYRALVASLTAELEAALNVARANPQQLPDRDETDRASAHIPDVRSELVVRTGHSCQAHPQTIAEVCGLAGLRARVWPSE